MLVGRSHAQLYKYTAPLAGLVKIAPAAVAVGSSGQPTDTFRFARTTPGNPPLNAYRLDWLSNRPTHGNRNFE